MSPEAAGALLAMSGAVSRSEAYTWAGIAVLRGATADEAHAAVDLWLAEHDAAVQVVGR